MRAFLALLLAAIPLTAQEGHGLSPEEVSFGGRLFFANCVICHGPEGDGVSGVNLASNRFRRATTDAELVGIVQRGVPGTPMPPGNYNDRQASLIVGYLHSMAASPRTLLGAITTRDPANGKAIVTGKGQCLNCHRIGGEGGFLGPNLGEIGATRRTVDLERALLDPSADIRPDNRTLKAVRNDGTVIQPSRLLNQDTYSLQILDSTGHLRSLQKASIKDFEIMKNSPMPVYKGRLTDQEVADTVAYLATLKGHKSRC